MDTIQGEPRAGAEPAQKSSSGSVNIYSKPEREMPPLGAILGIIALVVLLVLLIVWAF
ncbi:MAG: hypothetical protein ACNA8W_14670 [Bradymonadaceae bacterium]